MCHDLARSRLQDWLVGARFMSIGTRFVSSGTGSKDVGALCVGFWDSPKEIQDSFPEVLDFMTFGNSFCEFWCWLKWFWSSLCGFLELV